MKSQARQHRDWLHELHKRDLGTLQKVVGALKKIENLCRIKKTMFLPIRDGIGEALQELELLKKCMERNDCFLERFEYHLRDKMAKRIKEVKVSLTRRPLRGVRKTFAQLEEERTLRLLKMRCRWTHCGCLLGQTAVLPLRRAKRKTLD